MFFEGQKCYQGIRAASEVEEEILGKAFLGKGIMREYSEIGRGADKKICQMAAKARQNLGSALDLE